MRPFTWTRRIAGLALLLLACAAAFMISWQVGAFDLRNEAIPAAIRTMSRAYIPALLALTLGLLPRWRLGAYAALAGAMYLALAEGWLLWRYGGRAEVFHFLVPALAACFVLAAWLMWPVRRR